MEEEAEWSRDPSPLREKRVEMVRWPHFPVRKGGRSPAQMGEVFIWRPLREERVEAVSSLGEK